MKSLQEVADELGISKQLVAQDLKSGLTKVWNNMKHLYFDEGPFNRMVLLGQMFNISSPDDWSSFFYSFSKDIRNEIFQDARERNLNGLKFLVGA